MATAMAVHRSSSPLTKLTYSSSPTHLTEDNIPKETYQPSLPLAELTSSSSPPRPTFQYEDGVLDGGSDEYESPPNQSSDPAYLPGESPSHIQPFLTTTGTPLRNRPIGQRSLSSASRATLAENAHNSKICMLTHKGSWGGVIQKAHMIAQATRGSKV
jgi:hypothetical protein